MERTSFTAAVARASVETRLECLPPAIRRLAGQCLLDWLAVAIAGSSQPVVDLLAQEATSTPDGSTVIGRGLRAAPRDAALLNAASAHALDYDDVNAGMSGHPSAAIVAAILAQAEAGDATVGQVIESFVAGYEAACTIGRGVEPHQYERGFHASGTTGTVGAAVGVAHLLGLDTEGTARAIGLGATSASGLKAVFGTMGKPFNVGTAAADGLVAARLAGRGVVVPTDVLESAGGFASTFGAGLQEVTSAPPPDGFHLAANLFKYHASCYGTHSCIEGVRRVLDEEGIDGADVRRVVVHATHRQGAICAIEEPSTALEAKFSLRHVAAMVLEGWDTAAVASFDGSVADAAVAASRTKVEVVVDRPEISYLTPLEVTLADGRRVDVAADVSEPDRDLDRQEARLAAKARALGGPIVGSAVIDALIERSTNLDVAAPLSALLAGATPPG